MRTLLVTGVSSGIGQAVGEKLLDLGHRVIGCSRRQPERPSHAERFHWYPMDLTALSSITEGCDKIANTYPELDALVSCAGQGVFSSLEEYSHAQISRFVDLNLLSHIHLARAFLPHMKRLGRGDIIFMGSDAALQGSKKGSLYCACKFALRGLAQSLRAECATRGVRVSIIQPGMTDTPFYEHLSFQPGRQDSQHIRSQDIAELVAVMLQMRPGTVIDEIQLSPLTKVIDFKKNNSL